MSYKLFILPRAGKNLSRLPTEIYANIRDKIISLGNNPRPHGCAKLAGREGWRIRVGKYRVIYEINDKIHQVTVLDIGHRKDIYN